MNRVAARGQGPLDRARESLRLDRTGRPACSDARTVLAAIELVVRSGDEDARDELVIEGLLRDSQSRYDEHVAPRMRAIGPVSFEMGTSEERTRHFCGEAPRHNVVLSSYLLDEVNVTNRLLALIDARRLDVPIGARDHPAAELTWWEASLFALWIGCRLPTEAEWEFACGAGGDGEWCCGRENRLHRHAWFSENSGDRLHPVATLEPNELGFYDLHGNVWEWCLDDYDQDFYHRSSTIDPVNREEPRVATGSGTRIAAGSEARGAIGSEVRIEPRDRVCRGGSVYALAEMCRTRYRLHEPPGLWTGDLGLRLARDCETSLEDEETRW